jgi:hypothetical protein
MLLVQEAFVDAIDAFEKAGIRKGFTHTNFHIARSRILRGELSQVAHLVHQDWDLLAPLKDFRFGSSDFLLSPSESLTLSLMVSEWLLMAGLSEEGERQVTTIINRVCTLSVELVSLCQLARNLEREMRAHLALLVANSRTARSLVSDVGGKAPSSLRGSLWLVVATWLDSEADVKELNLGIRKRAWQCATDMDCSNPSSYTELVWLRAVTAEALGKHHVACGWWRKAAKPDFGPHATARWYDQVTQVIVHREHHCSGIK